MYAFIEKCALIRKRFIALPINTAHLLMLTSVVRDYHRVLQLMAEYYLHYSILKLQRFEKYRKLREGRQQNSP